MSEIIIGWEHVSNTTDRMMVVGGWLIREKTTNKNWIYKSGDQYQSSVSICFIPDPGHKWVIKKEQQTYGDVYYQSF